MDRHIFADFCNASSHPVSAFRQDYTFAATGNVQESSKTKPSAGAAPSPVHP